MLRPHFISRKLTIIALGISVLMLVVGGFLFYTSVHAPTDSNKSTSPTVTPGQITVEGTIVCLPKPGNGPQTLECAFGIRADDGKHYGLRGLNQDQLVNGTITTNARVKVVGIVSQPISTEIYDVVGNIQVDRIEVISVSGYRNFPISSFPNFIS